MDMRVECYRPVAAYTMVPNRLLRDGTLSPTAKACLIFMASHAPGWIVRRRAIMEGVGISIRTWTRAAAELRARGALRTVPGGHSGKAGLRGRYLQADWSEWLEPADRGPAENSPPSAANPTTTHIYDVRERDPDSDPKGIRTRIPKGSPKKREERKNARTRAEEREAAPGRREDVRASAEADAAASGRVLPSVERRREIARELGLDPDTSALWRLTGAATEP